MCGIAAFSLTPGSKQNARELAHALLTQIENRGSHASGFAYVTDDGNVGIYKNPKPGSQLPLHELPRNAKTVILHTRYATQGSPQDNRNNHPVISTDKQIALVHNGVISNDFSLREALGIDSRHGEVDSLVIPTLLAKEGIDGLGKLAGYAAIAWIDSGEAGDLNIARLKSSPVNYTWLYDGSFVMASTSALLTEALESINAYYGGIFELAEQRMLTVTNGFIMNHDKTPLMTYNARTYAQYSGATAGGHGTTTPRTYPSTATPTKGSEDAPKRTGYLQPTNSDPELPAGVTIKSSSSHTSAAGVCTVKQKLSNGKLRISVWSRANQMVSRVIIDDPDEPKTKAVGTVGSEVVKVTEKPKVTTDPEVASPPSGGSEDTGANVSDSGETVEAYLADLEEWRRKAGERDKSDQAIAMKAVAEFVGMPMEQGPSMALDIPLPTSMDWDADWEEYIKQMERADIEREENEGAACSTATSRYTAGEGFYIVDNDGDMTHYPTMDDLEGRLRYLSKTAQSEFDVFIVEQELRWINHIVDIGSVSDKGDLISWIDDMADIDYYESAKDPSLGYIREGAGKLATMKGA